jgi:hypothetical protein
LANPDDDISRPGNTPLVFMVALDGKPEIAETL